MADEKSVAAMRESNVSCLPPIAERRTEQRRRVLLAGVVIHDLHSFDCTIRNYTSCGVRIVIPKRQLSLGKVYFIDVRARACHLADIVWAGEWEAGLRYIESFDANQPQGNSSSLHKIWSAHAPR